MRARLRIHPARIPLRGRVRVPSDKSIAHRALILASLGTGVSELHMSSGGEDVCCTRDVLRALGVRITHGAGVWRVQGVGLFGLRAPSAPLHVGESGTTARLMAGLLSAQEFSCGMHASGTLQQRPMSRVIEPLRSRGARIHGANFPLRFEGMQEGEWLGALEYQSPVPSAQVKSALLLAGLYARGATVVLEPMLSRDHTERMMHALGVPVRAEGHVVALDPAGWSGVMREFSMRVPGDASSAFALLAAAIMVPGSEIEIADVSLNPTRLGGLDALRASGVHVQIEPHGEALSEPFGDVGLRECVGYTGFDLSGELLLRSLDEVPVLAALAARATGKTWIRGAAELRLKESDRLAAMVHLLGAFGVHVELEGDDLCVHGLGADTVLRAANVDSAGDHRIAMAAILLALVADGPCDVAGSEALSKSFAGFVPLLRSLGARVEAIADA